MVDVSYVPTIYAHIIDDFFVLIFDLGYSLSKKKEVFLYYFVT